MIFNSLTSKAVNFEQTKNDDYEEQVLTESINTQSVAAKKSTAAEAAIKRFDSGWCVEDLELSSADRLLAESQIEDWDEYRGRARVKTASSINLDDADYPNNFFVAPYQELAISELEALAMSGDKWAMVTLVQVSQGDLNLKHKVAKQLLIQGASYYALEYLVIEALSAAKNSYRQTGNIEQSHEHIIDALSYVYFGLNTYSTAALTPYLAITSSGYYKENISSYIDIKGLQPQIEGRYLALSNKVKRDQNNLSIQTAQPSRAIKNEFYRSIAIHELSYDKVLAEIAFSPIGDTASIMSAPCLKENSAKLQQKLQQMSIDTKNVN
ncbi:hypothetical protein [Shewanella pneumatophori]|uniref:Uncharacterized protein n=1 Tax=Shewanella pneumatophori TaxID=314092 RepID=A0A9X1ZDX4_9GAMM|nr:hypothetical protein [Shewanella pneumatophori]MCL1137590.1 hypothetical protein [Shewanella pneumatophori]